MALGEVAKFPRQANTAALERREAGAAGGVKERWRMGSGGKVGGRSEASEASEAKERRRGTQK